MVEMKGFSENNYQRDSGNTVPSTEPTGHYGMNHAAPPNSTSNNKPGATSGIGGTYGKDMIGNMVTSVNQDLLISKTFYFFFFSAFGSLFPLMAVYFKQLGMNPTQSGLLIGIRPLVEFLSAPFWGGMADRFQKGKIMLLCSLFAWIVFTLSLAFIQPPAASCVEFNATHHLLYLPDAQRDKRSVEEEAFYIPAAEELAYNENFIAHALRERREEHKPKQHKLPPTHIVGKSPNTLEYTLNYDKEHHISYVSPPFSSIVYKWEDVQSVFFLLLLLVVLGEFFSAPAITLADSATLSFLGEDTDNYGKQRMFGSLGWGLSMFFIGIALDHSTAFPDHPCGPHENERNYTICFATFSVLMSCAFIAATQYRFDYDAIEIPDYKGPAQNGPTQPSIAAQNKDDSQGPGTKSTVFAQTTRKLPEWFTVLRIFANLRYGAFLYVTWFMGFGIGLVFTFLFWHLQDLGGTPTLFGVASVINHMSEIFAYFFSFKLIRRIGHIKVLCVGLFGNVCRFLYISWLYNPWWVLPFELIQGITHAAVWAACCSYITHATPANLRHSTQGVLQGIHHGLGRGCGAVIGGIFVTKFGTQITFRGYGFACLIVLILFILINHYQKEAGFSNFMDEEPGIVMEETGHGHLAPHGVPANPIVRSLSKQNMGDQPQPTWDSEKASQGGFLGVPNYNTGPDISTSHQANNPGSVLNDPGPDSRLLMGPRVQTSTFTPQPPSSDSNRQYEW